MENAPLKIIDIEAAKLLKMKGLLPEAFTEGESIYEVHTGKTMYSIGNRKLAISLGGQPILDVPKAMAEMQSSRMIYSDERFVRADAAAENTDALLNIKSKGRVGLQMLSERGFQFLLLNS